MKKILIIIALLAIGLTGCAAQEDNVVETEKITVLTSPDYPPYQSIAVDGTLVGFDIELMEAIADILGVEVVWKEQSFDGIIAGLQAGQADMAISGMNVDADRKKSVDFSDIYKEGASLYTAVVLKEKGYTTIEDLKGLKIGVQTGTVQESGMLAIAEKYGFTVESRTTFLTIIEDIKLGRLDALVIDYENAISYEEVNPELTTFKIFDELLEGSGGTAIAFPKGSV